MFSFLKAAPNVTKIIDKEVIDKTYKYWRIRIMYSMYIGYAFFYLTRKSFTFAAPDLINRSYFNPIEIGFLGTVFYIVYGVSKFISGAISDKSNPRYFMSFGLIMTGVLNILFGICIIPSVFVHLRDIQLFSGAFEFHGLYIAIFSVIWLLNAFFQGWGWPPCARLLMNWYAQKERGSWWGIWNTSHNFGGAAIPVLVGLCMTYGGVFLGPGWGSVSAMILPGILVIVMGFVLLNRIRDIPSTLGLPPVAEYKNDYPDKSNKVDNDETISTKELFFKHVVNNKYIWLLCFSYVAVYVVRTAINDWAAVYLVKNGYTVQTADYCVAFFEIGGFFGSLVAGLCSDVIFKGMRGQTNVIYSVFVVGAVLLFWLVPGNSFFIHAAAVFLIGFFIFGPQMLIGMAAAELSHIQAAGMSTGFIAIFGYLGAAVSGMPVGYTINSYGWNGFFIFIMIFAVASVLFLVPLWRTKSYYC